MVKKGLIAGLANLILGIIISFGLQVCFPSLAAEYRNASLMRPWSDPLMTVFFAYPFIFGVVAAYLWGIIGKNFKGSPVNKAFAFAKVYFIIATIPGMFISYTTFQVSFLMIASWTITGFLEAYASGFIFAKIK